MYSFWIKLHFPLVWPNPWNLSHDAFLARLWQSVLAEWTQGLLDVHAYAAYGLEKGQIFRNLPTCLGIKRLSLALLELYFCPTLLLGRGKSNPYIYLPKKLFGYTWKNNSATTRRACQPQIWDIGAWQIDRTFRTFLRIQPKSPVKAAEMKLCFQQLLIYKLAGDDLGNQCYRYATGRMTSFCYRRRQGGIKTAIKVVEALSWEHRRTWPKWNYASKTYYRLLCCPHLSWYHLLPCWSKEHKEARKGHSCKWAHCGLIARM